MVSEEEIVGYFGYGSLVNRTTHRTDIVDAVPARLIGWQRCWMPRRDTSVFDVAILSVRRRQGAVTDGLLVFDRAENLPQIDERERHYRRVILEEDELQFDERSAPQCAIHVYEIEPDPLLAFGTQRVLRSYLDAVLQGFLFEHGEEGVHRFVAETESFDIGILDDRADPLYQRRVTLSDYEQALLDDAVAHLPSVSR